MRIPDAFTLAEILGAGEDETVIAAAERVVAERAEARAEAVLMGRERDEARDERYVMRRVHDEALVRVQAAEDAIAIHSARHLEALRLLDEQDGDLVGAVRRVVADAKAGWAEAQLRWDEIVQLRDAIAKAAENGGTPAMGKSPTAVRALSVIYGSSAQAQEAAMPAADPLGRDYRRRYRDREASREGAIARASGRTPLPPIAGGEGAVFSAWVTLGAMAAMVALAAAAMFGWLG